MSDEPRMVCGACLRGDIHIRHHKEEALPETKVMKMSVEGVDAQGIPFKTDFPVIAQNIPGYDRYSVKAVRFGEGWVDSKWDEVVFYAVPGGLYRIVKVGRDNPPRILVTRPMTLEEAVKAYPRAAFDDRLPSASLSRPVQEVEARNVDEEERPAARCAACGAVTKGPTCQYCGSPAGG